MEMKGNDLAYSLAECLSNAVVMSFKAQGHHWNVTGPDFTEYHQFFAKIYEDVNSSLDELAESMRKIASPAPYRFYEFARMTGMRDAEVGTDPVMMCKDLLEANEIMIKSLDSCFKAANAANEQGIADFIAGRDAMHKKWRWQLKSHLDMTNPHSGKFEAVQSIETEIIDEMFPAVEQPMNTEDEACQYCGEGWCMCPGNNGKQCICGVGCVCQSCHVVAYDSDENDDFAGDTMLLVAAGSVKAPKKDRIYGSKRNKPGSADGTKKIKFSQKTEDALRKKVREHNEKAPAGRKATLGMLKAVYRRGSGAFSSSHRPGKTRDQWAMARVNAFLRLLSSGRPANPNYKQDNDLLPRKHPRSSKKVVTAAAIVPEERDLANALVEIANKYGKFNEDETGIWAGYVPANENDVADIGVTCENCILYQGNGQCAIIAFNVEDYGRCRFAVIPDGVVSMTPEEVGDVMAEAEDNEDVMKELTIRLEDEEYYETSEDAVLAFAEYSDLGYEAIPAIRAAWRRGVENEESPFNRARELATMLYDSRDADLLPRTKEHE